MSYTNEEILRPYLAAPFPVLHAVVDQPFTLTGTEAMSFFGGSVDPDSFRVKAHNTNNLTRATISFTSGSASISATSLVPGSVVLAKDSSLGVIFTENVDYIVHVTTGTLTRVTSGQLLDGTSYTVWYAAYRVYAPDIDYELDAEAGTVTRLQTGAIVSGQEIRIDYTPMFAGFDESLVRLAAVEANAYVEQEVDPGKQYGGNGTLSAAATSFAMGIVCRAAASRELARLQGEGAAAVAWMKLAEAYDVRAEQHLRSFRPVMAGPNGPTHS